VSCANTWAVQYVSAMDIDFLGSSYNLVGNILGSQDLANLTFYNNGTQPIPQVDQVIALCGPSPCGPGSRLYDDASYIYALGFGEASDDGTGGTSANAGCSGTNYTTSCHSLNPYSTLFVHGDYSSATSTVTWALGVTQALPPSFYLSAEPAWFGNVPWPAIGPDVTGGLSDAFGYAYAIPAEVCYEQVMGGTDGTGSPLPFNADRCYGGTASTSPISLPVITSAGSASGTVGTTFSYQITASNNPTSFNATGLTNGLSVNTETGLISGTPTTAGIFTSTISATNNGGTGTATLTLTIGSAGTSNATFSPRVYPNPWRSDKDSGLPVTFSGLTAGGTVKIFTVSGHKVREFDNASGSVAWDLTNTSGDPVASGVYIYLITDGQGDKARGKVAIIR